MRIARFLVCCFIMTGATAFSDTQPFSKIAYLGGDGNDQEIFLVDYDGTNQVRLTDGIGFYVSVNVYNEVGEPPLSRIVDTTYLDWSPDGTRIAFGAFEEGNRDIFIMDADGGNAVNLTRNPASKDDDPTWSPDGRRIAFVSSRNGNDDIYAMDADGGNLTNLTRNPAIDREPTWSPEGTRIAFASFRHGSRDIYSMAMDGSGQVRLTDDSGFDSEPEWSPDGMRIAFASNRSGGRSNIYAMRADGSDIVQLTKSPRGFTMPTWSPDGTMIAFVATLGTGWPGIRVMWADGSDLATIVYSEEMQLAVAPSWSPFLNLPACVEESTWGKVKQGIRHRD